MKVHSPFAGILVLAIVLRVASEATANVSYILVAAFALLGRGQAIQALMVTWLFSMLNTALVPEAGLAPVGRYIPIFAAALSIAARSEVPRGSKGFSGFFLLTVGLVLMLLTHSLLFSAISDISLLKAVSWSLVVVTLISAWSGLAAAERGRLFSQLQAGLVTLLVVSLPLLAVPHIGYARNGSGFQGVFNQPQSFGPTAALLGALIGGRIMGERKPAWFDIALFAVCVLLVVLSEARTAGVAMILGLFVSAVVSPVLAGAPYGDMLPGLRSRRFLAVAAVGMLAVLFAAPLLQEQLNAYLFKRSDTTSLVEAATDSRGPLIEAMLINIQENPFTGIGFGIASEPDSMTVERDDIFGLPTSAAIEKGVMPLAVLEELGIFGAIFVFGWIFFVLRKGARSGVPQFAVLITLLLVNFGESMLFSVGGMGMLLLVLLAGAVTTGSQTESERFRA